MDAKLTCSVVFVTFLGEMFLSPVNAENRFNYNYLYADLAAGSFNDDIGTNSNVTSLAVGGKKLIQEHVLATLDYEARFIHPNNNTTTENYTLLPGVALRYSIEEGWDLIAGAKLGYVWSSQTNDITDEKVFSDGDFMWGGDVSLKYELDQHWQISLTGEMRRSDILDEDIFNIRADYQIFPRMALAGFYNHRNNGKTTVNEGGISVKYWY